MRYVCLAFICSIAVVSPSAAWAQFGLYGSPELLPLPPVEQVAAERAAGIDMRLIPLPPTGQPSWPNIPAVRPLPTRATYIPVGSRQPNQAVRLAPQVPLPPHSQPLEPRGTFTLPAPSDLAAASAKPKRDERKRGKPRVSKKAPVKEELTPRERPMPIRPIQPSPATEQPMILAEEGSTGSGVISRMLHDAGCYEPNPWAEAPCESEGDDSKCSSCGATCDICEPCFRSPWFASFSGLVMSRDQGNRVWTTYQSTDVANQLMHTQIDLSWEGGGEVRFGRRFCCDRWSVEATYWSLNSFSAFASQTFAGGVSTPLAFNDVVFANPAILTSPVDLFDGAQEHRIWRSDEIHNVELSLIRHSTNLAYGHPGPGGPLSVDWSLGARFFRFEDHLTFGSLDSGGFTWAADLDRQGFLEDRIVNNLAGFQFGADVNYQAFGRWGLFVRPKLGIYNNHIRNTFMAYRGDGELFAPNPAPTPPTSVVPGSYPVRSTKEVVSFLAQVDLGLDWEFQTNWNFSIGYRVLMASGIGLADHQIPPYVVDIPEIADIDHNGQLVLHGAFAGLEWNY